MKSLRRTCSIMCCDGPDGPCVDNYKYKKLNGYFCEGDNRKGDPISRCGKNRLR